MTRTARGATQPSAEVRYASGVRASLLDYLHACPICGCARLAHYCRVPSLFNRDEFIRYERCRECGTVLRNPRLPEAYRTERYANGTLGEVQPALDARSAIHYRYMVRGLKRLAGGSAGRLLDFGCGAGGFLVEARAAGFDVMGLELNRELARHVQEVHGIEVHQGPLHEPQFRSRRFDVIVSSQVFEHLLDPTTTLLQLRDHLCGPALLLIEVPNLRDIRERVRRGALMDDSHLFYFSASSLSRMLRDAGFEVLEVHQGLRPYGVVGERLLGAPRWAVRGLERVAAVLQVKTSLSIVARLTASGSAS